MMKKVSTKRIVLLFFIAVVSIFLLFLAWLFTGKAPVEKNIVWGISFSQKQAQLLGLSWKKVYIAILDDLGVKAIKITAYWDLIEPENNSYFFDDLDFQIQEAQKRKVKTILVIGKKVPRWPECHIPSWAREMDNNQQEREILDMIQEVVLRYRNIETIKAWQIENEPFFRFGDCPKIDEDILKKEIQLVKDLDQWKRPIIITDSGSNRFWFKTAQLGDIVGISLYRKAWFKEFHSYVTYPFPPVFYWRKAQIIKKLFGKEVICTELQAEPWGPVLLNMLSLKEQNKTMNLEQFRKNIDFAKKTGLREFYLWGTEWWYWLKEKENQGDIWNAARDLFASSS